ncbi:MAG: HEAT repeat domain-containing protein [Planctomycetes bacterium]|nr:HEAT repeat domain-containing protein [Planctomycetota bacterium]
MYIHILGRIGDVRAIEAMIEAMKRLPAESFTSRCEAMQSLSKLDTGRVIDFLINELQNDAVTNCNRCITLQQQLPPPESMQTPSNKESNEPCIFEVYPIRQCAARTLNLLTKRNWEPVFEEDFKTWAAWRDCTDRSVFDPNLLARTDEELAELGEKLIHREMCASRPGANYRGSEGRNSGIAIIGEHLRPLGSHATSVVLNEYKSRIGLICSDEGRVELRKWAATILNAIGTPDARATVESLLQN